MMLRMKLFAVINDLLLVRAPETGIALSRLIFLLQPDTVSDILHDLLSS